MTSLPRPQSGETARRGPHPDVPVEDPRRQARRPAFSASRQLLTSLPLLASLLAVCIVFQTFSGLFLNPRNVDNLLTEAAPLGFVAVASALMILMGEIDLSLGSVAGLTAAIVAVLISISVTWPLAVIAGLAAAAAIGAVQGAVVVVAGVRSFVVTLAGFLICYGLQLRILQPTGYVALGAGLLRNIGLVRLSSSFTVPAIAAVGLLWLVVRLWPTIARRGPGRGRSPRSKSLIEGIAAIAVAVALALYLDRGGGLPLITAIVILVTAFVWMVLRHTGPGRHLYAIGGDAVAAKESGIRVRGIKWSGFVATSTLAGLAGLCLLSYTSGADNTTGTGTLLLAGIGAAVVGGVSLLGGRGSVWGALGGALLLAAVQNGLNLLNLSSDMVYVVEGLVVMAALLVDAGIRAPSVGPMTIEIVDAQAHLNQLGVDASVAAMDAVGVDAAIIDQWPLTRSRLKNGAFRYAYPVSVEAVRRFPHRFAYIARLDPVDPDLEALMGTVRRRPGCLGVRVDQPPEAQMAGGGYDRFFALAERNSVPIWIILPGRILELRPHARRFANVQFVVDHAGMPLRWEPSDPSRFAPLDDLLALAELPNVAVKWGHMTKFSAEPFPYRDVLAQLARTVEAFGRERVMWESDFTMSAGYQTWAEILFCVRLADAFSESDKEWLLGRATRKVMRWDRLDDRVDVVAVAEEDWERFQLEVARRGRFFNGRIEVLRFTPGHELSLRRNARCLSTAPLPGAEVVTLDRAVAAAITGSRLVPISEVPTPSP